MERVLKVGSKGQTLVEMTLLLPLILLFVGGLTDVGLAFFVGTSMENAVREGARLAATGMSATNVTTQVRNRIAAPGMFTGGSGGITVNTSAPAAITGTACVGQTSVTVDANGNYNYMFLRLIGIDSTTMQRSETMRIESSNLCF